jgi:hypothetical protein|tara:strand:+ start:1734 stop:1931 length:198 start_codon:yes stop_codon:yes gene_type:complete
MIKTIEKFREEKYAELLHLIEIGASQKIRDKAHQRYIAVCEVLHLVRAFREDEKHGRHDRETKVD